MRAGFWALGMLGVMFGSGALIGHVAHAWLGGLGSVLAIPVTVAVGIFIARLCIWHWTRRAGQIGEQR